MNSIDHWFQDPPFLWEDMKYWPSGDVSAELPNDDPELKKDITSYSKLLSEDVITSAENRISSWLKLKRVIALTLLYKQKLLESVKTNKEPSTEIHRSCKEKLIDLREIQIAELEIIRSVQNRYFGRQIALLRNQKKLGVNNRIFKLDPHVDAQGVLRVGGRIQKSLVQQETQHPMLLPKDCRITNLIVIIIQGNFRWISVILLNQLYNSNLLIVYLTIFMLASAKTNFPAINFVCSQ